MVDDGRPTPGTGVGPAAVADTDPAAEANNAAARLIDEAFGDTRGRRDR
jgi:hypothetical protein